MTNLVRWVWGELRRPRHIPTWLFVVVLAALLVDWCVTPSVRTTQVVECEHLVFVATQGQVSSVDAGAALARCLTVRYGWDERQAGKEGKIFQGNVEQGREAKRFVACFDQHRPCY